MKEKKSHWAEKREKKKSLVKLRKFIRPNVIYNLILLAFLGVVIYSFVFSNFLEITKISIRTNGNISIEEIRRVIDNQLDGKYFKVFLKNNFIFFNSKKTATHIKNEFKKIKKITIDKKFPDTISILIEERNLILTLCSRGECYFIDENGYAYEKINSNIKQENQQEVIKLIDESGKEIVANEFILLPSYVEFLTSIADEVKSSANIEILNEYRTSSRISEEAIVQTKKGWDIYLNAKIPINKSAQTLKTLLNRHLMLRDLNELEYIDLRSENRVFYRMKGGVTQEEEELKKEAEVNAELEKNNVTPASKKDKKDSDQ